MIIKSDWHIHTNASYDASLSLEEIAKNAKAFGFERIGITDHANFNDDKFLSDLNQSVVSVKEFQILHQEVVLGVELTPIEKPEFDYIAVHGTREGYVAPIMDRPYEIELAQTKEELVARGIRYAIGAAHWRVDVPNARALPVDKEAMIRDWYRQQMWLACDERVTILGHPWYNEHAVWYDDFSAIPRSMNMDIAHALKENKKYVECNTGVLYHKRITEKFRREYAEFLRELFEMGIPVTYGSDAHQSYNPPYREMEKILAEVGFTEGDFSGIMDEDFWF